MYFFVFFHSASFFSLQTNPGLSFPSNLINACNELKVRGAVFASLYSLYSFNISKTKKKIKVDEKCTPKITGMREMGLFSKNNFISARKEIYNVFKSFFHFCFYSHFCLQESCTDIDMVW